MDFSWRDFFEQAPEGIEDIIAEDNDRTVLASYLELLNLGPIEQPMNELSSTPAVMVGSPAVPRRSPSLVPTIAMGREPSSETATSRSDSTALLPNVRKMWRKQMIRELEDDYLLPSWALEGKRIRPRMFRNAALVRRRFVERKKFVEGHQPMTKLNLQRLLDQCRKVSKRDMTISTLRNVLRELDLFTCEQWAQFDHDHRTRVI